MSLNSKVIVKHAVSDDQKCSCGCNSLKYKLHLRTSIHIFKQFQEVLKYSGQTAKCYVTVCSQIEHKTLSNINRFINIKMYQPIYRFYCNLTMSI